MMSEAANTDKRQGILLVISGPSGAGKGTIAELLIRSGDFCFSVSDTTREPREGEESGRAYYFISRDEFEKRIESGEMLEYAEYCGNLYGTPKKYVEKKLAEGYNVLLDIDTVGAFNVKRLMPSAILAFICPPSMSSLEARLRGRGTESEESIKRRLKRAAEEMTLKDRYDIIVVNEDNESESAAELLMKAVSRERDRRLTESR